MTQLRNRVAVRLARPEDEPGLARLDAAAWTPASGFPSVMERAHDLFFTFFTDDGPPGEYLVAELGGQLAGYVRVRPVTAIPENDHVLGVMGLAVAPGARRAAPRSGRSGGSAARSSRVP